VTYMIKFYISNETKLGAIW